MAEQTRTNACASRRRHRLLPPIDARFRAVIALLLVAAPLVACSDDGGDETYETPNEVDGSPTEGTPAGGVDSTEDGS